MASCELRISTLDRLSKLFSLLLTAYAREVLLQFKLGSAIQSFFLFQLIQKSSKVVQIGHPNWRRMLTAVYCKTISHYLRLSTCVRV